MDRHCVFTLVCYSSVNANMWSTVVTGLLLNGVVLGHTAFDQLTDDFWAWRLEDNPEFASNVGDHKYTDRLEDLSLAAIDTRKAKLEEFLGRLAGINRDVLEEGDRVSYDVMKDTIQEWLDGWRWRNYGPMNPINFLEGIQNTFGNPAGQVKFETEADFSKFAIRIRSFGDQIDQIITRMQQAVDSKTTNHRVSMESVPAKLDTMLAFSSNVTGFPMYKPYLDQIDTIVTNATRKEEIRSTARTGISYLLQKARDLKTFIVDTYLPNCRSTFGVYGLPNGAEYYQATLKWQLSLNISANEIHEMGLREVNRINEELTKIVKRANFQGTNKDYFGHLRQNSSLFISDPTEALQAFRDMYNNRIVPKLPGFFKDIPDIKLVIAEMTYDGPSGIYKNGAPDGSRPGTFYANVREPVPRFDMAALVLHETDPGHHLQDAYALSSPDIPMFRRATDFSKYFAAPMHFPFYTAYSEGWGLYSEDLGNDMEIYQNDLERLGKFGLEIFRAARLVVDTGIHAKQWSRDKAIAYMMNYTAYSESFIGREINRYSTWPGQACSYMIGKLKIQELRKKASRSLCNAANLQDFHSVILSNGAMPLWVMENVVDEWIEKTRKANNIQGQCGLTSGASHVTMVAMAPASFALVLMYLLTK